MPINNVSDTARWVAYYRAMESERPDAIFRDPFARQLAGPEGERIVRELPQGVAWAPPLVVRTAVLDEMIQARIADGADLVLNLAAGLDTRPWRLPLPATLRWIDVDLPGILDYKTTELRDATPVCRYEAIATDLTDPVARDATLARATQGCRQGLVITEGLLIYLDPADALALGTALHAQPRLVWWLFDIASPALLQNISRRQGDGLRNAPFRFAPAEGTAFFAPAGWREVEFRSAMESARTLHRDMKWAWLWRLMSRLGPAGQREQFRRLSGVALLHR
ncbi:MAG TPA: SAM-dependent methyltransferase [Gemmatimonadales bacterium]|jgi:methyltransferase (TIGR00027 family)